MVGRKVEGAGEGESGGIRETGCEKRRKRAAGGLFLGVEACARQYVTRLCARGVSWMRIELGLGGRCQAERKKGARFEGRFAFCAGKAWGI